MRHPTLRETIRFMAHAHTGQRDKSGMPYWTHPVRVMQRLRTVGTDVVLHAALLHDVVEDTDYGLGDLADMGYDRAVLDAIDLVSRYTDGRDRDRSYIEWIRWIVEQGNMAAILVKYGDLLDNNAPGRLATLSMEQRVIEARQRRAIALLEPHIPRDVREHILAGDIDPDPLIAHPRILQNPIAIEIQHSVT